MAMIIITTVMMTMTMMKMTAMNIAMMMNSMTNMFCVTDALVTNPGEPSGAAKTKAPSGKPANYM